MQRAWVKHFDFIFCPLGLAGLDLCCSRLRSTLEGTRPQQGSWRCPGAPRRGPAPQGSAEDIRQRAPWTLDHPGRRSAVLQPQVRFGGAGEMLQQADVTPRPQCSSVAQSTDRPHLSRLSLCHQDLCSGPMLGHWVDAGSMLRAPGLLLLAVCVLLFSSLQWESDGSPFGIRRTRQFCTGVQHLRAARCFAFPAQRRQEQSATCGGAATITIASWGCRHQGKQLRHSPDVLGPCSLLWGPCSKLPWQVTSPPPSQPPAAWWSLVSVLSLPRGSSTAGYCS